MRGINLDLPHTVATAQAKAAEAGVSDRFTAISGDFFESVPGADLYLLKTVLHDWNDDDCVRILRNCRASARLGARAIVVDNIIKDIGGPAFGPLSDLLMLVTLPGRERELDEFDALFAASGWRRINVSPTGFEFSIQELEAI
jgi:hypothetical protein